MEVADKVVVITGAASGIGRAMALRFAAAGARAIVLADLDKPGAASAAREIAGAAAVAPEIAGASACSTLPVFCDVARAPSLADLVRVTEEHFGSVDLFCANAGVGFGGDLDTPDELWEHALSVNVRSHIAAARLLVPAWVRSGRGGYFLSTASAAGVLGLIGAGPYAVSKHAAVAFAEWLSVTYGSRGVRVSCLCPMAVRTPLLADGLSTPGVAGLGLRTANAGVAALDPLVVADCVLEGLRDERFLILPHPQVHGLMVTKASDPESWMRRMRGMQANISAQAALRA